MVAIVVVVVVVVVVVRIGEMEMGLVWYTLRFLNSGRCLQLKRGVFSGRVEEGEGRP